ncbi:hypothetical protein [Streptomyces sp. NBC_00057]|uniref:hypothetical protein n=1 Tax=Streptomyces sp. NBC_00057 TaxID=2975634 RepID=UPI003255A7B8
MPGLAALGREAGDTPLSVVGHRTNTTAEAEPQYLLARADRGFARFLALRAEDQDDGETPAASAGDSRDNAPRGLPCGCQVIGGGASGGEESRVGSWVEAACH